MTLSLVFSFALRNSYIKHFSMMRSLFLLQTCINLHKVIVYFEFWINKVVFKKINWYSAVEYLYRCVLICQVIVLCLCLGEEDCSRVLWSPSLSYFVGESHLGLCFWPTDRSVFKNQAKNFKQLELRWRKWRRQQSRMIDRLASLVFDFLAW